MDTSKTYIKMCEKAEEIQELWRYSREGESTGDWFYAKDNLGDGNNKRFISMGEVICSGDIADFSWESSCDFGGGIENFNDAIWLPRQDQLQTLSGLSWQEFDKECLKYDAPTKEQAGIRVVMKILAKTIP